MAIQNQQVKPHPYQTHVHRKRLRLHRYQDILYENQLGEIERDDIVDPLPFDIDAPVVHIEDRDYAYFYREIGENQVISVFDDNAPTINKKIIEVFESYLNSNLQKLNTN